MFKMLTINSLFTACIYMALFQGSEGAGNIVLFLSNVCFLGGLLSISETAKKALEKKPRGKIRIAIGHIFTAIHATALIWFGWMWCGTAMVIGEVLLAGALSEVAERQAAKKAGGV